MIGPRRYATALAMVMIGAALIVATPVATATPPPAAERIEGDIIAPIPYEPAGAPDGPALFTAAAGDPLNLVLYPDELRRYSLGHDVFEVWECPESGTVPMTAARFVADAETKMTAHFTWLSNGRYDPDYIVGGTVPVGQDCRSWGRAHATGRANGALFITGAAGGYAGPGYTCAGVSYDCPTTYPANRREGVIGVGGFAWTTLAHEMGHMLSWPHSKTGTSGSDYDNAIDLMSGNYGIWSSGSSTRWGTYPDPYATVAINRYGAGWLDPGDVIVWDGTDTDVTLHDVAGGGTQALVIDTGSSYYVLGSRVSSSADPFPTAWTGVEIYQVTRCSGCWGLSAEISPTPPVPFTVFDRDSYAKPLPHVLGVGTSIALGTADVTILERTGDFFTLSIAGDGPPAVDPPPGADPPPAVDPPLDPTPDPPAATARFRDVPSGHMFLSDVEWLAAEGITKGCNPPANDLFCPDAHVTRGQMAAFLARALGYVDRGAGNLFSDDHGSIFETDIDRLGTAGVTKGCNPPTNDRYCPDAQVTRAQMAAFLVRAVGYLDRGIGDLFSDDDASIFETDIDRLGTAGVTKGCNPPTNDRYCPDAQVTRAQMAAFLHRALG